MRLDARRILVPVNGKHYSERTFRWACQMARESKTELHAVYVIEVPLELSLESEISEDINKGEDILARIEASGVILRLRQAQGRVITTLLNKGRMDRLSEYEGLARNSSNVYTAADLMEGLRGAIWGELDESTVTIDVYRRNLQRAFLETVERQLNPPPPGQAGGGRGGRGGFGQQQPHWESDQRPVLRGELMELDALCEAAIERAGNAMTRLHLQDIRMEIERILDGDE